MITYHIYAKGHKKQYTIEKHIPKVNKLPEKYKYVYHTADDKEHEICTRTWIEVPEMRTSDKLSNVPSGYDTEKLIHIHQMKALMQIKHIIITIRMASWII